MRFPFTFMGVMALGIGLWVGLYLTAHRSLDPASQLMAGGAGAACIVFGAYVLIRRVRRGPQH